MVMFFAWTLSPMNRCSFFIVCLLFAGFISGDAAPAVLPHLRQGTVYPAPTRHCHSFDHATSFLRKRCARLEDSHKV